MFKVVILLLLALNLSHSEWIEEGEYFKLNHDLKNIKEMRYSIDTTHIILINDTQINYYNKYTGEFSKSFSVPVLSDISDTLKDFTNPILSIDEKIITYTNTVVEDQFSIKDIEVAYFNLENNILIGISAKNKFGGYPISSNFSNSFFISESKDSFVEFNIYIKRLPHSFLIYDYYIANQLQLSSSVRIENINKNIKINRLNKTIALLDPLNNNKFCIIHKNKKFGIRYSSGFNSFSDFIENLKDTREILSFANDEENIFLIEGSKNILNKYDYVNDEDNYIEGDFNYNKVYYLSDNKFLGQSGKTQYILDGDKLDKLYKFENPFNSSVSFYDSTNSDFYFLSEQDIYKRNLDINKSDSLIPNFTTVNYAIVGKEVKFYNSSVGQYNEIIWEFEKDKLSFEENPSHTFTKSGTYIVKLTIMNNKMETTYSKVINIYDNIIADFEYEILNDEKPYKIKIKNNVENYEELRWYLNDKQINILKDSTIIINEYGKYELKQYVIDEYSSDEISKSFELFPTLFDSNNIKFKTVSNIRINIDYFNEQDIFHIAYKEKGLFNLYSISENDFIYNTLNYKYKFDRIITTYNEAPYNEEGYRYLPFQTIPILYYKADKIKFFENDFNVKNRFHYYDNSQGSGYYDWVDVTSEVITVNSLYNLETFDNALINLEIIKIDTIYSNYNNFPKYNDDFPKTYIFNSKKYFVQNQQLYCFDFIKEEVEFYDLIFKDLSEYYFASVKSSLLLIYKDLKNDWFVVILDASNQLSKKMLPIDSSLLINDIFGINNELLILSNNNKFYKYNIEKDEILNSIESELDTIQVLDELNGSLVMFGRKEGKLAYQIKNDDYSYLYTYDFDGDYINVKTNNKDKYVAQIKLDIDTVNTYVIYTDIYSTLSIKQNDQKPFINSYKIIFSKPITAIYIYDLLGRIVEQKVNYNNKEFNFNHLESGFYLYRIISDGEVYTGKFIK